MSRSLQLFLALILVSALPAVVAAPRRSPGPPRPAPGAAEVWGSRTLTGPAVVTLKHQGVTLYQGTLGAGLLELSGDVQPLPPPLAITQVTINPNTVAAGQGTNGSVILNRAPSQPVQIILKADGPLGLPASITINTNQTSGAFAITTPRDQPRDYWYSITASYNGQSKLASLLVRAAAPLPIPQGQLVDTNSAPLYHALPGTIAWIKGSNFGPVKGTVFFDPIGPSVITFWSDTLIVLVVPNGPPYTQIAVKVARFEAGAPLATIRTGFVIDQAAPAGPPVIQNVTDASGLVLSAATPVVVGTQVTINGSSFGSTAGRISWGQFEFPQVSWSNTRIVATVALPSGAFSAGAVEIKITRPDGQSASGPALTVVSTPLPTGPKVEVSGNPLDFGTVPIGTTKAGTISVRNVGLGTLVGQLSLPAGSPWSLAGATDFSLASDQASYYSLQFKPATAGPLVAMLTVTSNDPASPHGVTLLGVGTSVQPAGAPQIERNLTFDNKQIIWPLAPGMRLKTRGKNFGTTKGVLFINGFPMPTDSWTDTEITWTVVENSTRQYPGWVTVRRADGREYSGMFLADGSPPLPEPPLFSRFTDDLGAVVTQAVEGTRLHLLGSHFGSQGMVIYSGWAVCKIVSWTDTEIVFLAPFAWWDKHVSSIEVFPGMTPGSSSLSGRKGLWPSFTIVPDPRNANAGPARRSSPLPR